MKRRSEYTGLPPLFVPAAAYAKLMEQREKDESERRAKEEAGVGYPQQFEYALKLGEETNVLHLLQYPREGSETLFEEKSWNAFLSKLTRMDRVARRSHQTKRPRAAPSSSSSSSWADFQKRMTNAAREEAAEAQRLWEKQWGRRPRPRAHPILDLQQATAGQGGYGVATEETEGDDDDDASCKAFSKPTVVFAVREHPNTSYIAASHVKQMVEAALGDNTNARHILLGMVDLFQTYCLKAALELEEQEARFRDQMFHLTVAARWLCGNAAPRAPRVQKTPKPASSDHVAIIAATLNGRPQRSVTRGMASAAAVHSPHSTNARGGRRVAATTATAAAKSTPPSSSSSSSSSSSPPSGLHTKPRLSVHMGCAVDDDSPNAFPYQRLSSVRKTGASRMWTLWPRKPAEAVANGGGGGEFGDDDARAVKALESGAAVPPAEDVESGHDEEEAGACDNEPPSTRKRPRLQASVAAPAATAPVTVCGPLSAWDTKERAATTPDDAGLSFLDAFPDLDHLFAPSSSYDYD